MWIYDLKTLAFLEVNTAAVDHYGYSREEFKSMTLKDIRPEEDLELLNHDLNNTFRDLNKAGAWRHIKKNGELIYVEIVSHITVFDGKSARHVMITDVTDKYLAEKELHTRDKIFQHSIDLLSIISFDGKYQVLNPAWTKVLGWSQEEMLASPVLDFVHPDDRNKTRELMSTLISKKNEILGFENRYLCSDGSVKWLSWNGFSYPDDKMIIGVARDVTKQKLFEQELIRAKEKAQESDRLKSAFLANMSHEIRTPLNSIMGFSEILDDPDLDNAQIPVFTKNIFKSSQRLLRLITDIVDFAKIETGEVEILNTKIKLNQVLVDLVDEFVPLAEESGLKIEIETDIEEEETIVCTDQEKVRTVLSALINNAIKFTPEGSVKLGLTPYPDHVAISVKDTGIGISPENQQKIFNKFRKIDQSKNRLFGGTGLGLAIAGTLAKKLNGYIDLESVEGLGSTFWFKIPRQSSLTS